MSVCGLRAVASKALMFMRLDECLASNVLHGSSRFLLWPLSCRELEPDPSDIDAGQAGGF